VTSDILPAVVHSADNQNSMKNYTVGPANTMERPGVQLLGGEGGFRTASQKGKYLKQTNKTVAGSRISLHVNASRKKKFGIFRKWRQKTCQARIKLENSAATRP